MSLVDMKTTFAIKMNAQFTSESILSVAAGKIAGI